MTEEERGALAYQLTKRLVIDMPTARAAVDAALLTNKPDVSVEVSMSEDEKTELLDWVSACQSAYHIDSTPKHPFGGLPSVLDENRKEIVDYVNALLIDRASLLANAADGGPVRICPTKDAACVEGPRCSACPESQPVAVQEAVDIAEAMQRYLRRCMCGGMTKKQAEQIEAAVEDAQRLGYFTAPAAPTEKDLTARFDLEAFTDLALLRESDILREISAQLEVMLASAEQHHNGEFVTGYTVKTGALHRIIGLLVGNGFRVNVPNDFLNVQPTPAAFEWPECKKCSGNLWQCMACQPAHASVRDARKVKDKAAIESACRYIEQNIAPRKCDSDAVSNCWRCNSVYLAKRMREILATKQTAPKAEQSSADAEDAARYRWLRGEGPEVQALWVKAVNDTSLVLEALDREIDAARDAQGKK